jgi:hypothetical protein
MRSGGRFFLGRLLDERDDPPSARWGPRRRPRVLDLVQGDGALATVLLVERDQRADVEIGEDVAVDHDEPLVDAGVERGEADGAGGVERFGLDGVVEVDAGAAPSG